MKELEKALKLEEKYLFEMAYNKIDAMERCASLGEKFVEHFHKIYNEPNSQVINHWCNEMQAWYDSVIKIVLKPKSKHLTRTQMRDWFFTFGSSTVEYFNNIKENEIYEEFIDKLEDIGNVKESIDIIFEENNIYDRGK